MNDLTAQNGFLAHAMASKWAQRNVNSTVVNVKWRSIVSTWNIFENCIVPFKSDFVLLPHRLQPSCYAITQNAEGLSTCIQQEH